MNFSIDFHVNNQSSNNTRAVIGKPVKGDFKLKHELK